MYCRESDLYFITHPNAIQERSIYTNYYDSIMRNAVIKHANIAIPESKENMNIALELNKSINFKPNITLYITAQKVHAYFDAG